MKAYWLQKLKTGVIWKLWSKIYDDNYASKGDRLFNKIVKSLKSLSELQLRDDMTIAKKRALIQINLLLLKAQTLFCLKLLYLLIIVKKKKKKQSIPIESSNENQVF